MKNESANGTRRVKLQVTAKDYRAGKKLKMHVYVCGDLVQLWDRPPTSESRQRPLPFRLPT